MNKIISIKSELKIDQGKNQIQYFEMINSESKTGDYSSIIKNISNSNSFICIASTDKIEQKIIEALYSRMDSNIRVYIVLKSFTADSLVKFDKKKPALIREVPELENDFIIIDNNATLFINSLSNSSNIRIEMSLEESHDLFYLFNYYFWNKAKNEKILDRIDKPMDSPYPPFSKNNESINIIDQSEHINLTKIIVPRKKEFAEIIIGSNSDYFISEDVMKPIYFSKDSTTLGNFIIKRDFYNKIGMIWESKRSNLGAVNPDYEIIPFESDWKRTVNIKTEKTVSLMEIKANNIETLKSTKPDSMPGEPYTKKITYLWNVLPPTKPTNVQRSSLYKDYSDLQAKFRKDLEYLKKVLTDIIDAKIGFIDFFSGTKRKANENYKRIEDFQDLDVLKMKYNEFQDFFTVNFELFYNEICNSSIDFKNDLDRKEKEANWRENKAKKLKTLEEKNKELGSNSEKLETYNKLISQKSELDEREKEFTEKDNPKFKDELLTVKNRIFEIESALKTLVSSDSIEKKIKNFKAEISILENEIKDKYTSFEYKKPSNELHNLKKTGTKEVNFMKFKLPRYPLPEVGILFEDKSYYYLEIEYYEELNKAQELAEKRYIDKQAKIVAKED